MGIGKDGYYKLNDILGYNAKYNIILSDRGRGKSWAVKWFLLQQEGKFLCIYRQKPDMVLAMKDWLDQFIEGDKDHEKIPAEMFEWKGSDEDGWELWYGGELRGFFRYLTQVNHIKQEKFPDDVLWCFWDEFIPLVYKRLPGVVSEGDALRTIIKTAEHDSVNTRESRGLKPLRVIMIANPFTWNSPVLAYFHCDAMQGYGIHRAGPGVVWEHLPPLEEKKKDNKMTVDEFLGDEVIKNQGFQDQMAFVQPIPKGSVPALSVRLDDTYFHFYQSGRKYFLRRSKEHLRNCDRLYGTLKGLTNLEDCLDKSVMLAALQRATMNGTIRYEDINTKFEFLNRINNVGRGGL